MIAVGSTTRCCVHVKTTKAGRPRHRARKGWKNGETDGSRTTGPSRPGKRLVNCFIRQFTNVAETNQGNSLATRLHPQQALKEIARYCGQVEEIEEIFINLRARLGITVKEATSRLTYLGRDVKAMLAKHANEIKKLVTVAYPGLGKPHRRRLAHLQRHWLAVAP